MKKLLVISLLFIGLTSCSQKSQVQILFEQQEAENKTAKLKAESIRACKALHYQKWEIGQTKDGKWNHETPLEEWLKINPFECN